MEAGDMLGHEPMGVIVEVGSAVTKLKGIVLTGIRIRFHRLEMLSGQCADDLQMAQFLGPNVHEQIFAGHVLTDDSLNGPAAAPIVSI